MFCALPLVFASESVTDSFLQLYHYLVYKVCISALCRQLIAVSQQSVENIPSFFCRKIKVVFLLPHTKITSALTISATADRRAFILPIHSIWLPAFSVSVIPTRNVIIALQLIPKTVLLVIDVLFHYVILKNNIFAHTSQFPDCHTLLYRVISFSCPCFCPYNLSEQG